MSKSIKFKNNNYLDTSGITHNKKLIENFLIGEIKEFTKNVNVSVANTWYDIGIIGSNLEPGTYIMEAYTNSSGVNNQYRERLSGIVAWYHSGTNDQTADEIPLSKAGEDGLVIQEKEDQPQPVVQALEQQYQYYNLT